MGSSGSSGWNTAGGGAVSARGISRRSPPLGVGPGAPSIDEINVPVLRLDRKCRITFANSTAATLFGVAAEELVGHRVEDFLAGEARLEGLFAIARSEGSAQDLVDLENGIRLSLTVFPDASVYNRMGTIVRLRNVDGALPHGRPDHRQIAALQQAIDVVPLAVVVLENRTGVVIAANRTAADEIGVDREALIGAFATSLRDETGRGAVAITTAPHVGTRVIVNFDRAVSDERTGTETLVWTPLEGFTRGDGSGSDRNSVLAQLTPRRREVLRLMCSGQNDSEIAGAMGISTFTVRNHVQAVFRTLGCHSRAQAIAIGYRGTA